MIFSAASASVPFDCPPPGRRAPARDVDIVRKTLGQHEIATVPIPAGDSRPRTCRPRCPWAGDWDRQKHADEWRPPPLSQPRSPAVRSQQPCLICGRKPSDPHHLRQMQPAALGRKASDEFAVPLCRIHHRLVHRVGNEAAWWEDAGIDPVKAARKLWQLTRLDEGRIGPDRMQTVGGPPDLISDAPTSSRS